MCLIHHPKTPKIIWPKSTRNDLFVQVRMVTLNSIGTLLRNHVNGVLNPTVGNDRDTRRVDYTKVLDAVNLEAGIHHTLLDVLGQAGGAARME